MSYREGIWALAEMREEMEGVVKALAAVQAAQAEAAQRSADLLESLDYQEVDRALLEAVMHVEEALTRRFNVWLERARHQEELDRLETGMALELRGSEELDRIDPATGKSNLSWIEAQIQRALAEDAEIATARQRCTELSEKLREWDTEVEVAQAEFSAARHRARLVSSALIFLASDTAALGPVGVSGRRPTAVLTPGTPPTTGTAEAMELLEEVENG